MKEAEKIICPEDIGREAQARVSSELHQMCEVCIWVRSLRLDIKTQSSRGSHF